MNNAEASPTRPTSPHWSRRRFLVTAGVGTAALLVSCGDDGGASADGAGSTTTPAGVDGFPVEIEGQLGTITLERAPERIVSVGQYRDSDAAVALGVIPLATPDLSTFMEGGISPWMAREIDGERPELIDAELPFERIAELAPDLIIGTDRSALDEEYDTLSQIAPTLAYANGCNEDPWQLTTRRVASALGRSDRVPAIIASVEQAITDARTLNPAFEGKTFTFGPVGACPRRTLRSCRLRESRS